jgi:hypothetical protein
VTSGAGILTVTVAQPPVITTQPAGLTLQTGTGPNSTGTFTVVATGTAPLSYQWNRGGAPIAGATSASYTVTNPVLADNGTVYQCVVTNLAGSATSNAATLSVTSFGTIPGFTLGNRPQAGCGLADAGYGGLAVIGIVAVLAMFRRRASCRR